MKKIFLAERFAEIKIIRTFAALLEESTS